MVDNSTASLSWPGLWLRAEQLADAVAFDHLARALATPSAQRVTCCSLSRCVTEARCTAMENSV